MKKVDKVPLKCFNHKRETRATTKGSKQATKIIQTIGVCSMVNLNFSVMERFISIMVNYNSVRIILIFY